MANALNIPLMASIRCEARRARSHPGRLFWARLLAAALVLVGGFDAFTTELALRTGGAIEINPVIRAAQEGLGVWWIAAKMAAHVLLAGAVLWFPNRPTLIAMSLVTLLTAAVAVNNLEIYAEIVSAAG